MLFIWYILFPGLSRSGLIPYYQQIDDLIFLVMALFIIPKLFLNKGKIKIRRFYLEVTVLILIVIFLSMLYQRSSWKLTIEFTYLVLRPLILLFYIYIYDIQVGRVYNNIVLISRLLILINLPAVLKNLATYNISIISNQYADSVVGFFPFNNNDALIWLYTIVLLKDFYEAFIARGNRKYYWLFAFEYLLLLSTINVKYILLVTCLLGLIIFMKSRYKVRNIFLFSLVIIYPLIIFLPYIQIRIKAIETAPVYQITKDIIQNNINEYNPLLGTGPGTFTSESAIESNTLLAKKYVHPVIEWRKENFGSKAGTLSRPTSSALTLFGEIGIFGVLLYVGLILYVTYRNYKNLNLSYIFLIGFVMGLYVLIVGMFMNVWFWGTELFLLSLSAKYLSDMALNSNSKLLSPIAVE